MPVVALTQEMGSLAKDVALRLADSAQLAVMRNESTRDVDVQVESRNGRVALAGIVVDEREKQETERVVTTVAGKGNVDNALRLMSVTRKFTHAKT